MSYKGKFVTGDALRAILTKMFGKLSNVAFTGDYNSLSGRPVEKGTGNNSLVLKKTSCNATTTYSVALGQSCTSSGSASFTHGQHNVASAINSHAEGSQTEATATNAHSEGGKTKASGKYSHAEGYTSEAQSDYSHAEGNGCIAVGTSSHAEGDGTSAIGKYSHSEGRGTIANADYSHASGKYSVEDTNGDYIEIVGIGTSATKRANGRTLDFSGNGWYAGDLSFTYAGVTHHLSKVVDLLGHELTFNANGGTKTMAAMKALPNESFPAPANGFTKTSAPKTFNGWNTAADGSGTAYAVGDSVTLAQDTVFYAQWV